MAGKLCRANAREERVSRTPTLVSDPLLPNGDRASKPSVSEQTRITGYTPENIEDWDFRVAGADPAADFFYETSFQYVTDVHANRVAFILVFVERGAMQISDGEYFVVTSESESYFNTVTQARIRDKLTRRRRLKSRALRSLWREWKKYGRVKPTFVPLTHWLYLPQLIRRSLIEPADACAEATSEMNVVYGGLRDAANEQRYVVPTEENTRRLHKEHGRIIDAAELEWAVDRFTRSSAASRGDGALGHQRNDARLQGPTVR